MKLYIIGTTGSGKTTLARLLQEKLSLPHIELDDLYWLSNWQQRSSEEFTQIVKEETSTSKWVASGNYRQIKEYMMDQADVIVWLDYSFFRVFSQLFKRTMRNIYTKTPISGGNQETLYLQFFSSKSILWWAIKTHLRRRRNYTQMMTQGAYKHKWVRIRNRHECKRFIQNITRPNL